MPGIRDASLVVDFLNTLDVESGTDEIATEDQFARWAELHELTPGSLDEARALRTAMRRRLGHPLPGEPAVTITLRMELADDGHAGAAPRDVCQAVAASSNILFIEGLWARLKLCPADDCYEAFYDTSRNRSRVWCDMADCGNLSKVRRFRSAVPDQIG